MHRRKSSKMQSSMAVAISGPLFLSRSTIHASDHAVTRKCTHGSQLWRSGTTKDAASSWVMVTSE